jgi:selenocysteine lyase/cysteine desulfurase
MPPRDAARGGFSSDAADMRESCRQSVARFFGIENSNAVAFTSGATEALNLAIRGLELRGKTVITTAGEHNSALRPLSALERAGDIALRIAPCTSEGLVDLAALEKLLCRGAALAVINHCSNVTGAINDLATISALTRQHGTLLLTDVSQSAGHRPIDCAGLDIDMMAFTGHKALFGIRGIGGLYVRDGLLLRPLKTGGTGVHGRLLTHPDRPPVRYEAGTPNMPGIAALHAGIACIESFGLETIAGQCEGNRRYCIERLETIPGLRLHGARGDCAYAPIVSFTLEDMAPEEVGYLLEQSFDIALRAGVHCAPLIHRAIGAEPAGTIRISCSYLTKREEIDQAIDAIRAAAETGGR